MQHLSDLLARVPLPSPDPDEAVHLTQLADVARPEASRRAGLRTLGGAPELVHDLGADLPAGHLHVWGGPTGAGKTSFLLSLLHAAAARGRRVAYATYDLAPESLALRMLAMSAGVELDALPDPGGDDSDCTLAPASLRRVRAARASLSRLPFSFLAARGFSVASIRDRLVRLPFRAEVLAVDYLQGVIREPGTDLGAALRALSDLAAHLHVAIICAVRPQAESGESQEGDSLESVGYGDAADLSESDIPDRIGWIGPVREAAADALRRDVRAATSSPTSSPPSGPTSGPRGTAGKERRCARRSARVLRNRHGDRPQVPLELDEANGSLERAPSE